MEDIDGGLHPAGDGQSLDEDEDGWLAEHDSLHIYLYDPHMNQN